MEFNTTGGMNNTLTLILYWNRLDWIIPTSLNILWFSLSTWILFSLIHYGIKTKRWKRNQSRGAYQFNSRWVYAVAVTSAFVSNLKFVVTQISYNVGFGEHEARSCEIINDLQFFMYSLSLFVNLSFIWSRQRTFYVNKMLKVQYSKCLRFVSAISIVLLLTSGVMISVATMLPISYSSTPGGCIYKPATEVTVIWFSITAIGVIVIAVSCLIILLIYPLQQSLGKENSCKQLCCGKKLSNPIVLHQNEEQTSQNTNRFRPLEDNFSNFIRDNAKQNNISHIPSSSSTANAGNDINGTTISLAKKLAKNEKIKAAIKRALLYGIFTIFSYVFLIVFVATPALDQTLPGNKRISSALDDANVLLNELFVVFSFVFFKSIFTSPCAKS